MTDQAPATARAFGMGRIAKQSVVYGIGALAGKAVAFIMLPLYTRYLTPADYGTIGLIDITMEVVSIVAGSRLAAGIFHYYHQAETPAERADIVASAQAVIGFAFALAGIITFFLSARLSQLVFGSLNETNLIRIAAISLSLQSLLIVPTAYLQLLERPGLVVASGLVRLVIQLGLNTVLLVVYHMGAEAVLIGSLVANLVIGVWLTVVLVRNVGVRFTLGSARKIVRFGAPFVGTHLAKFAVTYGDRYLLKAVWGVGAVGVYGLAYQFGFLLGTLGDAPYRSVWEPIRFEVAKRADRDDVYSRAFVHLNLIQVTMAVAISLFIPEFLRVMATPEYYEAANWVPIILAGFLLQSWSLFLNTGLFIKERTHLITWASWLGAAVAVAGYIALIPPLGGMGAGLATLISFVVLFWATYRYSQREWPIAYRWAPVLRMLVSGVILSAAGFLLPSLWLPVAIAAKTVLLALYIASIWIMGVITPDEKELVRKTVRDPRAAIAPLFGRTS